ncbi:type II toxin-antitoxin system Phd/YefM family antitoxin [candidate division KSB1 bacterium]
MKATAKDLRFHSKELLDAVSRGEKVTITFRGKPLAKLIPVNTEDKEDSPDNSLFGIWKDNDMVRNVQKYVRDLREERFK